MTTPVPMSDEYLNGLRESEHDYFPAGVVWKLLAEIDNLKARPEPTQTPVPRTPNLENAIGYVVVTHQVRRHAVDTAERAHEIASVVNGQVCALVPVEDRP